MRDILFRGFAPVETKYTINFIKGTEKAFVNGEWIKGNWVYGDFNRRMSEETEFCITVDFFEDGYDVESYNVFEYTVGQYTGLKDKNGKKIFEGDIIKNWFDEIGIVKYEQKRAAFVVNNWKNVYILWTNNDIEVIGNIFENPELIKNAPK